MPVSKISDRVERRAKGGEAWWTVRQRLVRIQYRHSARKTLGRGERDPARVRRIELGQDLDHDLALFPRAQQRLDRRNLACKPDVHDSAAPIQLALGI